MQPNRRILRLKYIQTLLWFESYIFLKKETHITTTAKFDGDLAFDKQEGCDDDVNAVEQAILHADVDVPEVTQVETPLS